MRTLRLIILFAVAALSASAQFKEFVTSGGTLPATCTASPVPQLFVLTGATPGLYWCDSTDHWTKIAIVPLVSGSGAVTTLTAPAGFAVCTSTCTVTLPAPIAGAQYCVRNAPGSATVITLAALGASKYYELTDHSAYATANQKLVSGGAATDQICVVGLDATHYLTYSSTGTWTDTP